MTEASEEEHRVSFGVRTMGGQGIGFVLVSGVGRGRGLSRLSRCWAEYQNGCCYSQVQVRTKYALFRKRRTKLFVNDFSSHGYNQIRELRTIPPNPPGTTSPEQYNTAGL